MDILKQLKWYIKKPFLFISYHYYCSRSSKCDYFCLKQLTRTFSLYSANDNNAERGNKCYGNYYILRNALGEKFQPKCMIEHGLYFYYTIVEECMQPGLDTIYTYSKLRENHIRETIGSRLDKRIIPVGPYIKYAKNFKSLDELRALKVKFGRILLVYPSHNFPNNEVSYNNDEFEKIIDEMAKDYDTVFISMIGYDIELGANQYYEDKGYVVVTSGSRSDPYFLNRQRDLIELADMTISNSIGTHIGYCICLGTPHYLFAQKIDWAGGIKEQDRITLSTRVELYNAFGSRRPIITPQQIEIVKKYWGEFSDPVKQSFL